MRVRSLLSLLALILSISALIGAAVARYPPLLSQPGARNFIAEPILALAVYSSVILSLTRRTPAQWAIISSTAVNFGLLTAALQVLDILLEDIHPVLGPAQPILFMFTSFYLWGTAAYKCARLSLSFRAGLYAAALAAGLCMLLAVVAGLLFELFLAPPSPQSVATWPEFLRSHWTDPRAFAIANTFDSAFTHLLLGPFLAVIFGTIGAAAARFTTHRSASASVPPAPSA